MGKTVSKREKPGNPLGIGGFTKESPRPGPGRGKKKAVQEAGAQIAAEMEYAYANAEKPEDSVGIKQARLLAHNDYPKFLAMYLKAKELSGEHEGVKAKTHADEPVTAAAGEKEEGIEVLANKLLDEWSAIDGPQVEADS